MNNIIVLFIGELQRMKKYNILAASLFVSLTWIGILHFTEIKDVTSIFPLLLYLDTTSMALLLIGVTMFFEKQEGEIKNFLISPISKFEYILAKTFANIFSNLLSLIVLYIYVLYFKEININIYGFTGAVILVSFFHSLIGVIFTYYSKDFTELLIGMMKYTIIFMLPILLEEVGLIQNDIIKKFLYIIPTKSSMSLLQASIGGIKGWEIYISIIYLVMASALLFFIISNKFEEFAIKESGV